MTSSFDMSPVIFSWANRYIYASSRSLASAHRPFPLRCVSFRFFLRVPSLLMQMTYRLHFFAERPPVTRSILTFFFKAPFRAPLRHATCNSGHGPFRDLISFTYWYHIHRIFTLSGSLQGARAISSVLGSVSRFMTFQDWNPILLTAPLYGPPRPAFP